EERAPAIRSRHLNHAAIIGASTRAVSYCIAYEHLCWNQPCISLGVTRSKATAMAAMSVSAVRAPTERRNSLVLENNSSIGVSSGLYGGSRCTVAPAASTAARTAALLWACRLSHTT